PGNFLFANMSSLMFRRQEVMNTIGYWDSVRFAGDSEFLKRLTKAFGEDAIAKLQASPLSFTRQSSKSLTGSSAFGYPGYFMGVRKEYAEVNDYRSEEHTSEPQSRFDLVCRLLLEKKKKNNK